MGADNEIAVDVVDVSKRFRLYHEKYPSLKERVLHAGRNPHETFWALRDVSFSVDEGETVGVLGRNGSGKSTLLKCISGILQPSAGKVVVRGHLAALLELGAGFQPELSGRENIFLNASLLGLSTREVEKRFDAIVEFAELEQFIDNQIKYYSSGMYVRLGFAVAVNMEPDILVIDEVLAVGDENFQRKCLGRIKEFQVEGRTILFVTHAADLVRDICDRAVVLANGHVLAVERANEAVALYHEYLVASVPGPEEGVETGPSGTGSRRIEVKAVETVHPGTGSRPYVLSGEPLTVNVGFEALEATSEVVFCLEIRDPSGTLVFWVNSGDLGQVYEVAQGPGTARFELKSITLLDGTYDLTVEIASAHRAVIDIAERVAQFEVVNPGRARGLVALDVALTVTPGAPLVVPN